MTSTISARERRALVIAAAILVPALLVRLAILPYLEASTLGLAELDRARAELQRERALISQGDRLAATLEHRTNELIALSGALVTGETATAAQAALSDGIRRTVAVIPGRIHALEPLPPETAGPGLQALPVRVQGESDLEGVLSILIALETSPLLLDVTELSLQRVPTSSYDPGGHAAAEVISFRLLVKGFMLDLSSLPAAADARKR